MNGVPPGFSETVVPHLWGATFLHCHLKLSKVKPSSKNKFSFKEWKQRSAHFWRFVVTWKTERILYRRHQPIRVQNTTHCKKNHVKMHKKIQWSSNNTKGELLHLQFMQVCYNNDFINRWSYKCLVQVIFLFDTVFFSSFSSVLNDTFNFRLKAPKRKLDVEMKYN